jgi:hypothetical protein
MTKRPVSLRDGNNNNNNNKKNIEGKRKDGRRRERI